LPLDGEGRVRGIRLRSADTELLAAGRFINMRKMVKKTQETPVIFFLTE
jgi:hypothetical protein